MGVAASHAIILDAGSSGTRLYAYQYQKWDSTGPEPPRMTLAFEGKYSTQSGIAANSGRVKEYLKPIIDDAVEQFRSQGLGSPEYLKGIRLFMLGTAGMRDLGRTNSAKLSALELEINTYLKSCEFDTGLEPYRTISGEEEAAYGWIAANYSLGTFSELGQVSPQSVGYLEMGGASAQIAFRPFKNELTPEQLGDGDITRVKLGNVDFDLFLKTYDLGSDKAWREYQNDLIQSGDKGSTQDQCLDPDSPHGREWEYNFKNELRRVKGTGDFDSARFHQKVTKVLDRLSPPQNPRGSRLLDENLIGSLKARRFVGGANFWYSTRGVFGRDINGDPKKAVFRFEEYAAEVHRTTMLTWPLLQLRLRHKSKDVMGKAWFVAEWVKCVLVEGFGFQFPDQAVKTEDELSFRPYNGPNGAQLTWTLGKMVHFVTGNTPVQERLSLDDIIKNHDKNLAEVMRAKAVHWEEMLWDYLSMVSSLRTGLDPDGNKERALRLEDLARSAAATSWSLRSAADKMVGKASPARLASMEEQRKIVQDVLTKVSEAATVLDSAKSQKEVEVVLQNEVKTAIKAVMAAAGVPEQ